MTKYADAADRAIEWLTNNPDRHIKSVTAIDAQGKLCNPISPKAECFCAIGRFAKEADLSLGNEGMIWDNLDSLTYSTRFVLSRIFGPNDDAKPEPDIQPFCKASYELSNSASGLSGLRAFAKHLRENNL